MYEKKITLRINEFKSDEEIKVNNENDLNHPLLDNKVKYSDTAYTSSVGSSDDDNQDHIGCLLGILRCCCCCCLCFDPYFKRIYGDLVTEIEILEKNLSDNENKDSQIDNNMPKISFSSKHQLVFGMVEFKRHSYIVLAVKNDNDYDNDEYSILTAFGIGNNMDGNDVQGCPIKNSRSIG